MKDDFYLLGEVFDRDPEKIAEYNGVGIDGFVNVPQAEEMRPSSRNRIRPWIVFSTFGDTIRPFMRILI